MLLLGIPRLAIVVFQVVIRVGLRVSPKVIPFGWSWLLENPWRTSYRNPERVAEQCGIEPTDTVLEIGCGSGLSSRSLATRSDADRPRPRVALRRSDEGETVRPQQRRIPRG